MAERSRGPWTLTRPCEGVYANWYVEDGNGEVVCTIATHGAVGRADGLLLAAAPELLALCLQALEALRSATSGTFHGVEEVAEALEDVLARVDNPDG